MAATQVRRAGLPGRHKVTLPGRRAAGVQRNQQGGVPGNLLPQLQQQEEQTHSLGAKPGTSPHFLLNLCRVSRKWLALISNKDLPSSILGKVTFPQPQNVSCEEWTRILLNSASSTHKAVQKRHLLYTELTPSYCFRCPEAPLCLPTGKHFPAWDGGVSSLCTCPAPISLGC